MNADSMGFLMFEQWFFALAQRNDRLRANPALGSAYSWRMKTHTFFAITGRFRPKYWPGLAIFLQVHKNNPKKRGGEAGSRWRAQGFGSRFAKSARQHNAITPGATI